MGMGFWGAVGSAVAGAVVSSALTPKTKVETPAPGAAKETATANTAARDAFKRNALKRGVLNTVKNKGGLLGDTSKASIVQPALTGKTKIGQ